MSESTWRSESTWWRIKAFGAWLGACVFALLAFLHGFGLISYFIESQDRLHLAANIYIVILFFAVLVLAAWRQWLTIRKERYANITPILHQISHQIRDLNTYIQLREPRNGNTEQYEQFLDNCRIMFSRTLDQLKLAFTSLTSTHCRAAIKLTYAKEQSLYVYTLTRDSASWSRWKELDKKRWSDNHDPLDQNIQFAKMFTGNNNKMWHYACNDLTRDEHFRATSLTAYSPDYATRAPASGPRWLRRKNTWPLPYKSTIACVIAQGSFDHHQNLPLEVVGFLAVDSESRNVFEERWDKEIIFAVADALYGPVRGFIDAQNRAKNSEPAPTDLELNKNKDHLPKRRRGDKVS
jgi:hypothetical protein